jgi:general secretion pathway protein K
MSARKQRGAALIVVLLLVATLSFVLLSTTDLVTASVARSAGDRARAEMLWRAAAAEEIAREILEEASGASAPAVMTPGEGVFGRAVELPIENGSGAIVFRDATRCFNLNSLVAANGADWVKQQAEVDNFIRLAAALGLGDGEAQQLAAVIVDFLDTDVSQEPQGAEDGFYTALPTPFRTADGPIASVSELRAMQGVSRALYRRIAPYLCAMDQQPAINLNMLGETDAPLIHALTGGEWPIAEIRRQIEERPPGGWPAPTDFWAPFVAAGGAAPTAPTGLFSERIEARIRLEINEQTMEQTLLFEVVSGREPRLLARTFGAAF